MRLPRLLAAVTCAMVVGLGAASAFAADITMSVSPASTPADGTTRATAKAAAPVVNAGVVQQQITQSFDETKLMPLDFGSIVAPFGWTVTVSTDGSSFGSPPTTASGWSSVKAVRASGAIDSQGSFNGRQIATGAGEMTAPALGSFTSSGSSGDGYDVFFDDRNHVFNMFHSANYPLGRVDCHLRSGATCGPGWPFQAGHWAPLKITGWVDNEHRKLWFPTVAPGTDADGFAGFQCVDLANIATPAHCGGSQAAAMRDLGAGAVLSSPIAGLAVVGKRLFTLQGKAPGKLLCLDVSDGYGTPCAGQPYDLPGIGTTEYGTVLASAGKVYIGGGVPYDQKAAPYAALCFDPGTLALCDGWPTAKPTATGATKGASLLAWEQPNAQGGVDGVCFGVQPDGLGTTLYAGCRKPDGTDLTPNPGLVTSIQRGTGLNINNPTAVGTRVYSAEYNSTSSGRIFCFDVATNANCTNFPIAAGNYTVTPDPYNPGCIWKNDHNGVIAAYSTITGTLGCPTPPPWVDLDAGTIVPRMACAGDGAVREWRNFELTGPSASTYSSATLSVLTESREPVVSGGRTWVDVPIPANGIVDLSALDVADSGTAPIFRVRFASRSANADVSAKVTAVGDAPELCVPFVAEPVCPAVPAPARYPGSWMSPFATTITGAGEASLSGGGREVFGASTISLGVTDTPPSRCFGTVSGTTTVSTAAAPAAVGVPVTLKSAGGQVIATTTTDASGNYSFDRLVPGSGYYVEFGSSSGYVPTTATTTGASTNRSVTAGGVTDVDGRFDTRASAPSRSATVPAATPAVFDPFTAVGSSPPATPSNGATFGTTQKAATRLCDPTTTPPQNGTTVACTLTTRTTSQGVWTVNTNTASPDVGKITFTPAQGFSGAATPISYQVNDSVNTKAAGTLSPTVVGAPTASNNTSSGAYNAPQQIDVLANDSAATGAILDATTVKLCDVAPNAQTPPNCTATSVTIANEGTYAVGAGGVVTFTPLPTFTGTVQTPVRYQVKDSANQVASALITPSVAAPTPPTATPGTASVAAGIPKAFTTTTGTSGLATTGGADFDTARTCLVDPAVPGTCATSLTTTQGTWSLDRATGIATFTANQGLTPGQLNPVTYRVFDMTGQSVDSTLTPTLVGAPSATNNTSSGDYNTPQQIDVLANDAAASGATIDATTLKLCDVAPNAQTPPSCTATSVTIANEGTYSVGAGGVVTFTPLPTFTGTVQTPVRYQVKDSAGQAADALITPTVAMPPVPVATPQTASVAIGVAKAFTTLTGPSGLASTGASGFDTQATCLVDPASTSCGTTVTTADGTWTLTRATGVVSFTAAQGAQPGALAPVTYRVTDVLGRTATSTLTPTLVGPPTASNNTSSGAYNTPQQIDVLGDDTAVQPGVIDASTLTLCDVAPNAQTPPSCTATSVTIANEGTYSVANGQVTFTPLATFTGTVQTPVRYQVKDSANQAASALVTPSVTAPPAPTASPEQKTVGRGQAVSFTTLTGASGLATSGGPAFTTSSTCLLDPGTSTCAQGTTVTVQGKGIWSLDRATGVVTFTADPNAPLGTLPSIGYRVTDVLGATADSTLTPLVVAPPQATDNAITAIWNTPLVIDPLANDTADALTALNPTSVKLCATSPTQQTPPNCSATTVSVPGEGTYAVDPMTGRITFTPDPAFTGDATPVRYQVADGAGQVADARILLSVSPVAPTATGDSATVPAGGSATLRPVITPGTWPIDPGKTCLTVGTTCAPGAVTLTLPEGTYALDPATGVVTFTAAPGFSGSAQNPPKVMFTDMGGQSVMAQLAVTVQPAPPASVPAPTAPIALPDVESTGPGLPVTIPILGNDSSVGASAFDPSTLLLRDPATGRYQKTVSVPGQGTFQVNADGSVTFTPVPGFTGPTRALPYKVSDARGRTTSSTIQVIVQQGEPPWADPDWAQGPQGRPLTLNPLANDDAGPSPFDPASLRLRHPTTGALVTRLSIPGEGTYVVDPSTGTVTFTPVKGFAGKATPIRYRVRTTANRPAESTLNVHITSPGPALQIRTTSSRSVMRVGQRTTITLKIGNAGGQTAKSTVTRAAIPRGFSVANPMGGTVRDGYIYFRTGNVKAGGQTTRRFVLVAGSAAVGPQMAVYGRSRGGNVGPVADPTMIRVVAPAKKAAPVTG